MRRKHCAGCGRRMQRFGHTVAGTPRYFCPFCRKSSTIHRRDTRERHVHDHFVRWLTGKQTLSEVAQKLGVTRQALWKQFRHLFGAPVVEPKAPDGYEPHILVLDATYVHGNTLCVLVSVDEEDKILFRFAQRESYLTWISFLSHFHRPDIVVADGQKGLKSAVDTLWPDVAFQRCQFHVIQLVHKHLTRTPDGEAAKELLTILYDLKEVKSKHVALLWRLRYRTWEAVHRKPLTERISSGTFRHRKLRSARHAVRKALPHLFTFLDHPGAPNTTNLVEGWINTALAEGLRRHRGLRLHQKKTLVSIILSNLGRRSKE